MYQHGFVMFGYNPITVTKIRQNREIIHWQDKENDFSSEWRQSNNSAGGGRVRCSATVTTGNYPVPNSHDIKTGLWHMYVLFWKKRILFFAK